MTEWLKAARPVLKGQIKMATQESALQTTKPTSLARPLKILVPLIKQDLEAGKEAGVPYYRAAGEKLWEAKAQVQRGQWGRWLKDNFALSQETAHRYMHLANYMQFQLAANEARAPDRQIAEPKTLSEVTHPDRDRRHAPEWYKPVRDATNRVNVPRMRQEALDRENEAVLRRKLGLQLIDIGYKVLATKLHPDRGGSAAAMARLNKVRDVLKGAL